jgi:hypothetical protein
MTQYNTRTQEVKIYDKISLVNLVAPNLWEVDQCFGEETYQQLQNIVDTQYAEFVCGGLKKRLELSRTSPGSALIDQIGTNMTQSLSQLAGQSLSFMTAKYWLDLPTFGCQTHQDSEDIFVSYQVYLSSALSNEIRSEQHKDSNIDVIDYLDNTNDAVMAQGAKFLHVDPPVQIEFKPNHGYINLNSDFKLHRVDGTWDTRLSVMFQYARV